MSDDLKERARQIAKDFEYHCERNPEDGLATAYVARVVECALVGVREGTLESAAETAESFAEHSSSVREQRTAEKIATGLRAMKRLSTPVPESPVVSPVVSPNEVEAFLSLSEKATPGPWAEREALESECSAAIFSECKENPLVCTVSTGEGRAHGRENTEFIIQSRTLAPQFAKKVLEQQKIIDECDMILSQLEDTAKGFNGDLVTEARIVLMGGAA